MTECDAQFSVRELNDIMLSKSIDYNALFSILHTNCRSLNRNYTEIEIMLKEINCPFKILALTET